MTRAIQRPFDILWRSIMRLDADSKLHKALDLSIVQTDFAASIGVVYPVCATTGSATDDDTLLATATLKDFTGGGSNDEVTAVGGTRDHGLTPPKLAAD